VIGGGFLWRQVARSLVGLIPAWGIVPKVAVAYAGTYAVGYAILNWYQSGRKLTPKQMQALYVQAFSQGKEYARKLARRLPKPKRRRGEKGKLPAGQAGSQLSDEIVINKESQQDQTVDPTANPATADTEAAGHDDRSQPRESRYNFSERKSWLKSRRRANRSGQGKPQGKPDGQHCKNCGKISSADAQYCQYCGKPFEG
jgi:hypothetical protein